MHTCVYNYVCVCVCMYARACTHRCVAEVCMFICDVEDQVQDLIRQTSMTKVSPQPLTIINIKNSSLNSQSHYHARKKVHFVHQKPLNTDKFLCYNLQIAQGRYCQAWAPRRARTAWSLTILLSIPNVVSHLSTGDPIVCRVAEIDHLFTFIICVCMCV